MQVDPYKGHKMSGWLGVDCHIISSSPMCTGPSFDTRLNVLFTRIAISASDCY